MPAEDSTDDPWRRMDRRALETAAARLPRDENRVGPARAELVQRDDEYAEERERSRREYEDERADTRRAFEGVSEI